MPDHKRQRHASRWLGAGLALVTLLLAASPAQAHTFGLSQLELHVADQHVDVRLTTDLEHLDLAAALDTDGDDRVDAPELDRRRQAVADYLTRRLTLTTAGEPCPGALTALHHDAPRTAAIVEARYACLTPLGPLDVDSRLFSEQPGQHRLMVVIVEDDQRMRSALDRDNPTLRYEATAPTADAPPAQTDDRIVADTTASTLWQYLRLGIEHILIGLDHILFLLALLLVARRLRTVVALVTTFTVAHSTTLAAAALDLVTLPAAIVEPLIAASIVVVAVENLVRPDRSGQRARLLLVFAFGLMHGFGFAGVLGELGLPAGQGVPALLGFNLGVEVGQLAIVAVSWPLLRLAMRWPRYPRVVQVASALIGLAGAIWLVDRLAAVW